MTEFQELYGEWGNDAEGVPLPLSVATYMGTGAKGKLYAAPASLPGLPQMTQAVMVRSSTGDESASSAAVYATIELAGHFAPGSLVTLATGRVATILSMTIANSQGHVPYLVANLS